MLVINSFVRGYFPVIGQELRMSLAVISIVNLSITLWIYITIIYCINWTHTQWWPIHPADVCSWNLKVVINRFHFLLIPSPRLNTIDWKISSLKSSTEHNRLEYIWYWKQSIILRKGVKRKSYNTSRVKCTMVTLWISSKGRSGPCTATII